MINIERINGIIDELESVSKEMKNAAKRLEFEQAAFLRDKIKELREGK